MRSPLLGGSRKADGTIDSPGGDQRLGQSGCPSGGPRPARTSAPRNGPPNVGRGTAGGAANAPPPGTDQRLGRSDAGPRGPGRHGVSFAGGSGAAWARRRGTWSGGQSGDWTRSPSATKYLCRVQDRREHRRRSAAPFPIAAHQTGHAEELAQAYERPTSTCHSELA